MSPVTDKKLKVGIVGLGTIGSTLAQHLHDGIDGLSLSSVAVGDPNKNYPILKTLNVIPKIVNLEEISGISHFGGQKSFDSVMEYNINQVLVQSVSYSIIKNALAIEKGGLVCTLLALYRYLEIQFGIKIHITSRLKTEELLFGETYASALVLIGERELMEFQRICMLHSVPCSTIGRLQLKKVISINNQLIIPEKILNLLPSE